MNPSQELALLEELLNELIAGIQSVIQSGEVLSDEFQGILAKELEATFSRIEQLKGSVESLPANIPEKVPELNQSQLPSSNVEGFSYDDKSGRLFVRFLGDYPNRNGPIYAYEGVPKEIFNLFQKGSVPARTDGKNKWGTWWKGKFPSLGAALYTLIKTQNYPYQKIS